VKAPEEQSILAIDTSSTTLQLAVAFGGDRVVKASDDVEFSHGRVLMKKISDLLSSAELTPKDINCLGVATGPGSFTGLRIGLAAAKGMAMARDTSMVGVSMFDLAAYALRERDDLFHLIVPFKRDACFLADIARGVMVDNSLRTVTYDILAEELRGEPAVVIGPETEQLVAARGLTAAVEVLTYDAGDIIEIARQRLAAGTTDDPATLEPQYLQKSQAEIRFDKRHQQR